MLTLLIIASGMRVPAATTKPAGAGSAGFSASNFGSSTFGSSTFRQPGALSPCGDAWV